jgi:hypothetical protein
MCFSLFSVFRKKRGSMRESKYQSQLIKKLRILFPGCFILKNDPTYVQGVLDLLILFGNKWAMLEVKASATSPERPNQRYYAEQLSLMSFASFIYPENEKEVLDELQRAFQLG